MKWILLFLLVAPLAHAKVYGSYPPQFDNHVEFRHRLTLPHLYPGQSTTTTSSFLADSLRPGSSSVRWTSYGSYAVHLDKVHLMRGTYTVRIKSTRGLDIRMLDFDSTKLYLPPNYYSLRFDKTTNTLWLARYAD